MNYNNIAAAVFACVPLLYVAYNGLGRSSGQYAGSMGDVVLPVLWITCWSASAVFYLTS